MSSGRFRSQPTLQRTGERSPGWTWGLGLAVVLAVGAVIAVGSRMGGTDGHDRERPLAMADTPWLETPPPAPAPVVETAAPPAPAIAPAVEAEPAKGRRKPPVAPRLQVPARAETAAPPSSSDDPQRDYQRALARYQENERAAGYRWASDNRVSRSRYCRTAAQRTEAFMEGCMTFVRAGDAGRPARVGPEA